jgi:hypothetical protein
LLADKIEDFSQEIWNLAESLEEQILASSINSTSESQIDFDVDLKDIHRSEIDSVISNETPNQS